MCTYNLTEDNKTKITEFYSTAAKRYIPNNVGGGGNVTKMTPKNTEKKGGKTAQRKGDI